MKLTTIIVFFSVFFICKAGRADNSLPLKLLPAGGSAEQPLVFIVSGDGGWNSFIESVSECLTRKGLPVVGLDSKKYFWNAKTPDVASADINAAINHYLKAWNRKSYILVGYSFGGCVVPFIANRTPAILKKQMDGLYAISPDERGDFEIHVSDMLSLNPGKGKYDVLSEMKRANQVNRVCIFGTEESASLKRSFSSAGIKIVTLGGNHHFNDNYCALAGAITQHLNGK